MSTHIAYNVKIWLEGVEKEDAKPTLIASRKFEDVDETVANNVRQLMDTSEDCPESHAARSQQMYIKEYHCNDMTGAVAEDDFYRLCWLFSEQDVDEFFEVFEVSYDYTDIKVYVCIYD